MRRRRWAWTAAHRKRYATAVLLLAHLAWVSLGKQAYPIWLATVDYATRPMEALATGIESWRHERSLRAANLEEAQKELDALRAEVFDLNMQRQTDMSKVLESDEAINLLGLSRLLPVKSKAARVIANNRNAPFGGIIIDVGEDGGAVADMGVICAEGVVGRIWSVGKSQSLVLPLDAYNASTSVMLAGSRVTGVLQGLAPGLALLRYISIQETVQIGEPVYTSQLDNVFPKGMLVGHVSEAAPGDLEMNIVVALAAPMDRLGMLFVLSSPNELEFGTTLRPPPPVARRGAR